MGPNLLRFYGGDESSYVHPTHLPSKALLARNEAIAADKQLGFENKKWLDMENTSVK